MDPFAIVRWLGVCAVSEHHPRNALERTDEVPCKRLGTSNEVCGSRRIPCKSVFVFQEPPMEEAQPAWWLELDRAEAQQKKTEKGCSATQQAGLSSGVQPSRGSGVEGRKVRFASDPAANPNGFYENDAEFVISPAHPKLQTSLTQASEQSEMIAWELSDLDDATDIRRMLIPTVDTPRSSSAGSFSTSSLVDFHCGSHTSVSEPVFRELSDRSVHTASFGV